VARRYGARPWLRKDLHSCGRGCWRAAGTAAAATGGAPTPTGAPAPGSPSGARRGRAHAGILSLTRPGPPRKSFYYGVRYPSLQLRNRQRPAANDLRIDVVDAPAKRQELLPQRRRPDVPTASAGTAPRRRPPAPTAATPSGSRRRAAAEAPPQARAPPLERPLSLSFDFYGYAFPILGAHEFGERGGRFGAARSGHTHQGQDVMAAAACRSSPPAAAACSTPATRRRRQLPGDRRQGHRLRLHVRHLAEPSPLQEATPSAPASRSGSSATPATPRLPPPLRDLGRARLVRGRQPLRPAALLQKWDAQLPVLNENVLISDSVAPVSWAEPATRRSTRRLPQRRGAAQVIELLAASTAR
jgi:hypothetical protein